ncbi:type II secretion system protein [Virgibacillus phasianinus]|nr:type II secretion system protein [Virgibacillus phasianinus]
MQDGRLSNNNGFTLIEIIASIAILGMVIVVLLPFFPQLADWTASTDNQLVASNLLNGAVHNVTNHEDVLVNYLNSASVPACTADAMQIPESILGNAVTYKVNGKQFSLALSVCQSTDEVNLGLYRTHIQLYSDTSPETMLSDTYIYLVGGAHE